MGLPAVTVFANTCTNRANSFVQVPGRKRLGYDYQFTDRSVKVVKGVFYSYRGGEMPPLAKDRCCHAFCSKVVKTAPAGESEKFV